MSDDPKRPILALLTSHWVSMLGVALVTTAGFSWLFALPTQLRGQASNPYIGIIVFLVIPIVFVAGLRLGDADLAKPGRIDLDYGEAGDVAVEGVQAFGRPRRADPI